VLILVYLLVRKRLTMTYGLAPRVRRWYVWRRILNAVGVIALFFGLIFAAALDSTPWITTVLVLFLVSVATLILGHKPLAVVKHRGGEFWVAGCSPKFLARLQA
jgi:drug/metabolite transporter (DMT)-like permease